MREWMINLKFVLEKLMRPPQDGWFDPLLTKEAGDVYFNEVHKADRVVIRYRIIVGPEKRHVPRDVRTNLEP